jgi:hypothetical protein
LTRYSKEQALKGALKGRRLVEHSIGLGPKPNIIPPGEASLSGDLRPVEIGWHPVGGFGGKWFAERTGLGKMITQNINRYPDPTQHWAVLVGDYVHQLWMVSPVWNTSTKHRRALSHVYDRMNN